MVFRGNYQPWAADRRPNRRSSRSGVQELSCPGRRPGDLPALGIPEPNETVFGELRPALRRLDNLRALRQLDTGRRCRPYSRQLDRSAPPAGRRSGRCSPPDLVPPI